MKKHNKLSIRELCAFALIGALMFAMQIVMAALPNIHMTGVIIIVTACCFGWRVMYPIFVFCMMELLYWGFGIWAISYLYLWPALGAAAALLRKNTSALFWAAVAAVHGLLFGAGTSIPYVFIGGWEMAFANFISGIGFDLLHCAGNFVLTLTLYKPLCRAMNASVRALRLG